MWIMLKVHLQHSIKYVSEAHFMAGQFARFAECGDSRIAFAA